MVLVPARLLATVCLLLLASGTGFVSCDDKFNDALTTTICMNVKCGLAVIASLSDGSILGSINAGQVMCWSVLS